MSALAFETVGTKVKKIPVRISYRIIELFSGSLYSSPHKAIEELVANSYDAGATEVNLFLPGNLGDSSGVIWCVDNGDSMDLPGLVDLWQIGFSPKLAYRNSDNEHPDARKPIGKFGIGKLATYVVARNLTYVCHVNGEFLAVTMDYDRIDKTKRQETNVALQVRRLSPDQAAVALEPLKRFAGGNELVERLLNGDTPKWTAAAMSSLRPAAQSISWGRLEWILSTALPASPRFRLSLNGKPVVPSAEKNTLIDGWRIGDNPSVGKNAEAVAAENGGPYVEVAELGGHVTGTVELFEDVLTRGKAADWGRSHGFFVRVRDRLVNLDDPLFGNNALSHAVFNRFRMVIDANGLDDYLTSTRESVQRSTAVENFKAYLRSEFYHAAEIYETWRMKGQAGPSVGDRIGATSASLSRRPLVDAVRKLIEGELPGLLLTRTPDAADATAELIAELEASLEDSDDQGPIREVVARALGSDRFIAEFDPATRTVAVNILHPFVANFIDLTKDALPFELIAVAEVLTEAYLVEEGYDLDTVERIMRRRDEFLRELVSERRIGPAVIAQNIVDNEEDADGLEGALHDAFRSMGFEVIPIGGKGTPDGLATAILGVSTAGTNDDYAFTYDAKSTTKNKVKAKTVGVSTLDRHKDDEATRGARYSVVVAKDFEGGNSRSSALGKEAVKYGTTCIRARDLAALVQIVAARAIGLRRIRDLFETCRIPKEAHEWIQSLRDEPDEELPPLKEVLNAIVSWSNKAAGPVELGNIVTVLQLEFGIVTDKPTLKAWIGTLQRLAPKRILMLGEKVQLETSPGKVLEALAEHHSALPKDIRSAYMDHWLSP